MPSSLTAAEAKASCTELHFIDVREADEFAAGHIPNAIPLPLSQLAAGGDVPLPPDHPYVVYCQAGVRSAMAIKILEQKGFQNLTNLTDGYSGYCK
jgi:rhodanese-related sulfurtransferase